MLSQISSPADLAILTHEQLIDLSSEIRTLLVEKVSKTGGHLGPNLGVVELTIAIHRVFESPKDVIVFDTGHQSYVHKMLSVRLECSINSRGTPIECNGIITPASLNISEIELPIPACRIPSSSTTTLL